jgi:predicted HicB family RNase H-like nuclease
MKKPVHFEAQIVVRVAKPLRDELESAALADGRSLSNHIRKLLIDIATARTVARANAGAAR